MPDPYGKRIQELLDRIEEKYPPERIAAAERKWRNLWDFNQPFSQPPAVLHRGRSIDGVIPGGATPAAGIEIAGHSAARGD